MSAAQSLALTGSTGFVGRSVLAQCLASGLQVRALVRNLTKPEEASLALVKGHLADTAALSHLVAGCGSVIHIAGAIQAQSRDDFLRVNRDGTIAVAKAAEAAGVRRFVYVSSLAARHPDISDYAESKLLAEQALSQLSGKMKITILRPSAVYGPGDKATLPLIRSLLAPVAIVPGSKSNRFSLVHVNDFAGVCIGAVLADKDGVFEIDDTSGGYSWTDLAAVTRQNFATPWALVHLPRSVATAVASCGGLSSRITGRPPLLSHGKVNELYHQNWVTTGQGWPRTNPIKIATGLPQTVQWYRDHGWLAKRGSMTSAKPQSAMRL
jgi:nucleoside-diphosphate-sugar epimerase